MPRLRDGVIKRGGSWSYVIRVRDPATGVSKPRWVGGFETEDAAKAARDEARVLARRGGYVNRSLMLVTALSPVIGYDKAAAISYYAIGHDLTLKEAALAKGVSEELYDRVVIPLNLTRPGTADLPS